MRNRNLIVAAAMAIVFSVPAIAQTGKQLPDISGVWQRVKPATKTGPIAFQPWAATLYQYGRDYDLPGEQFRPELNPRISQCFPPDPNFLMDNDAPFEIDQSAKRLLMVFEWGHWIRQVWMDRDAADDVDVAWIGYSTGKWVGDTLVIDTTHIDDRNSYAGFIHTPEMRITERLTRMDHDTLVNVRNFDDPKAQTKPWTDTVIYKLKPDFRITAKQECDQRFKKEPTFLGD